MGKVSRKLIKKRFQKGHPYLGPPSTSRDLIQSRADTSRSYNGDEANKWMPRMTQDDYNLVVKADPKGRPSLPDHEGVCTGAKVFRPKKQQGLESDTTARYLHGDGKGEMRLLHKDRIVNMWNECIEEHAYNGINCNIPRFEVYKEVKKGICWSQSLKCTKCNYRSKQYKLYDEVPSSTRGPKYARPSTPHSP